MTTPYINTLVHEQHRMAELAERATCSTERIAATERVRQLRVEIQHQRAVMRATV